MDGRRSRKQLNDQIMQRIKQLIGAVCLLLAVNLSAQTTAPAGVENSWGTRLANHQTASMPQAGQTIVYVVHYFAPITENGFGDLFGIYGTANIQMGAEYGFSENASAFFRSEKMNKTQDLGIRYRFVQQDNDGDNPVSVAAAFTVSADARDKKFFGDNYYFIDRFFYTTQVAVSRQMNYRTEAMVNLTAAHFNLVPEGAYSTYLSLNPSLAFKVDRKTALFATFDFPVGIASASDQNPEKADPLVTIGTILGTPTHNFQLFISNGSNISLGKEYLNNHSGFSLDAMRIGFNIQVKMGGRRK